MTAAEKPSAESAVLAEDLDGLVRELTLEEKVQLLTGRDFLDHVADRADRTAQHRLLGRAERCTRPGLGRTLALGQPSVSNSPLVVLGSVR